MRWHAGFTLIELMMTVALAAIVLALAAPSLRDLVQNNRVTAHANALAGALALARSEAVRRGGPTSVCADAAGWQQGWSVRAGSDCTAGDPMNLYPPLEGITVTAVDSAAAFVRVSYSASGFKSAPA